MGNENVLDSDFAVNVRHWPEISVCLPCVTGERNAKETTTYVRRIEYWYLLFTSL